MRGRFITQIHSLHLLHLARSSHTPARMESLGSPSFREMLAFFDFLPTRLSHGFVEGKNNRPKALRRQGYGYANRRHLRLRILLEAAS